MKYILALVVILLASCGTVPKVDAPAIVKFTSQDEMDIAESVLRSLYDDNASAEQSNKVGASLCVNGKSPPSEFLTKFDGLFPKAFPCSASIYNKSRRELVLRGTVKPMISFQVYEISILSPTEAVAKGGYYEASLSSAGYTFKLSKVDGKWTVKNQDMDWIS